MSRPAIKNFSVSHPFTLKNRCKYCGQNKFEYYLDATQGSWPINIRQSRDRNNAVGVRYWVKDTAFDFIRHVIKEYRLYHYYAHSEGFKGYNPKYFRAFSDWINRDFIGSEMIIVVCASCYQEAWAYSNDEKNNLPENANRKAPIDSPIKAIPLSGQFW